MKPLLHIALLSSLLVGCVNLNQNLQTANPTGQLADNRWDYFNGSPVHYSSYHRTVVKDSTAIINERTDKFAGTLNVEIGRAKAYFTLGDRVVELQEFEDRQEKDRWVDLLITRKGMHDRPTYYGWTHWYSDAAGKYLVAIERRKQIVMTAHVDDTGLVNSIAYRPSRYLACQKLASLAKAKNEADTRALIATALVAGIQSYTSYSRSYAYDSYGNFGYAVTRDYSWAGDRAADALTIVFRGGMSSAQLQAAWQSLNCW